MLTLTLSLYLKSLADTEDASKMRPKLVKSVGKPIENKPKIVVRRRKEN